METTKTEVALLPGQLRELFGQSQHIHINNIEVQYAALRLRSVEHLSLPQSGTHKEWVRSRVALHANSAVLRLLYLTEAFCDSANKFNGGATATLVKGMVEIPLHLGYLVWIVSKEHNFEKMRKELDKLTWGVRDPKVGVTTQSRVTNRVMHERADSLLKAVLEDESAIDIFEQLYKNANSTGHHNYEATMFAGLQNGDHWDIKDRKAQFVFLVSNIFQLFLYADTVLFMANRFLADIDDRISTLPDFFDDAKSSN